MEKAGVKKTTRTNRTICLPFTKDVYNQIIHDSAKFRRCIDEQIQLYPELFPPEISNGYRMKEIKSSIKLQTVIRRIEIAEIPYTIRPSYIMPYMTGLIDNVENALFFRKFSVPYWAISRVFGKNAMYWYRMEQTIGRNSIVGTTIRKPEDLPDHISADEKHTWLTGEKVYVPTTVGKGCILGADIAKDAGEEALTESYKIFKNECQNLKPTYSPKTVNIDGWKPTHNAWLNLFTSIAVICCFLHIFIKIRDRGKKKYRDLFLQVSSKLWRWLSFIKQTFI
jgi:hypothetical protein